MEEEKMTKKRLKKTLESIIPHYDIDGEDCPGLYKGKCVCARHESVKRVMDLILGKMLVFDKEGNILTIN